MHPHLFDHIPAYTAFLIGGVLVGVVVGVWRLRLTGLDWAACVRLEIALAFAGLLGAKIYSIWERGGATLSLTDELGRSYRYPGGIIAVVLLLVLCHRRLLRGASLGPLADAIAPATGFALGIVRLGCFAFGCCFGREADMPWAVEFPAYSPVWNSQLGAGRIADTALMSLPVHPLQLYFAICSVMVALIAMRFERHAAYAGQAALLFLTLDGLAKLGLETLRAEPMVHLQTAALATAVGAASLLLVTAVSARRRELRGVHPAVALSGTFPRRTP